MEAKTCPERIEKRVWKNDVKKDAKSRPKGVMSIIGGTNVGPQGLPTELLAKPNSDKKQN